MFDINKTSFNSSLLNSHIMFLFVIFFTVFVDSLLTVTFTTLVSDTSNLDSFLADLYQLSVQDKSQSQLQSTLEPSLLCLTISTLIRFLSDAREFSFRLHPILYSCFPLWFGNSLCKMCCPDGVEKAFFRTGESTCLAQRSDTKVTCDQRLSCGFIQSHFITASSSVTFNSFFFFLPSLETLLSN